MSSSDYELEKSEVLKRLEIIVNEVRENEGDASKMCDASNIDRTAIWRMIRGERKLSINVVYGVCHYTGCSPRWLLFGEGQKYFRGYHR